MRLLRVMFLQHQMKPKIVNPTAIAAVVACLFSVVCSIATAQEAKGANETEYFRESVLPILKSRCYSCHSHQSGQMEGGLALDWRSGWEQGGSRGKAIVPNDSNGSLLIRAVEHKDSDLKMPEEKLPDGEIEVLRKWIQEGAYDDRAVRPEVGDPLDWWSLRPLIAPTVPVLAANPASGDLVATEHRSSNPIDAFLLDRLQKEGLSFAPRASSRELVRRLYVDLHGVLPSPEQVASVSEHPSDQELDELVDRLLASPRYAERWARHWLDTIHFADSHGYEHDVGRENAWPYRDYVIGALDRDISWSEFIRQQLAVDVFAPEATELLPALGFLGAGTFDLSTYSTGPVTFDYMDRDDMLTQTMAAFVSTTANCARCHAHKFDPISQEDYYALQAVFAGVIKGDISYDPLRETASRRAALEKLKQAVIARDPAGLESELARSLVAQWSREHRQIATWKKLDSHSFISLEGATLTKEAEEVILASGHNPDTDTYVFTGTADLPRVTAIRLDLFPHDSLPMKGPGRCQNGNLHLSEFVVQVFTPGATAAKQLKIARVTADFNQAGWGIERAIDGDPKTAWGIHPAVGVPHHAVFVLEEPVEWSSGTELTVTLKQLHGGSHLLGAFRLSVTDAAGGDAVAVPAEVETVMKLQPDERSEEQTRLLAFHFLQQAVDVETKKLPAESKVYAVGTNVSIPTGNGARQQASVANPKPVHLLHRGEIGKPEQLVPPGALSVMQHSPGRFVDAGQGGESLRRAALADWIAHRENVLTWRSIVNRVWHYHFGRGICDTPSDFGRMGGVPSHPELLDWLAIWFRDDAGGSLKKLHRLIVTSQAYRQQCLHNEQAHAKDADNRWLWRQNRLRLDADSYRDSLLAISGRIDWKMGGPGVEHFTKEPGPQSTPKLDYAAFDWNRPEGNRRSIYRVVWRGIPDPMMAALDFPDLGLLSPVRGFTASPLQSLVLTNNPFVLHHCKLLEDRMIASGKSVAEQTRELFQLALQRDPTPSEIEVLLPYAQRHGIAALGRVLVNTNEFLFIP
ncbi:MAG: hypothetical protein RL069_2306 [Planctomycetota bacterium]